MTISPTFSISPTFTETATPSPLQITIEIRDAADNLVATLAQYGSYLNPSSVNIDASLFEPETKRFLVVSDGAGGSFNWYGVNSQNTALPNGAYTAKLTRSDGQSYSAAFYLKHGTWDLGSITLAPSLVRPGDQPTLFFNFGENVELSTWLYNVAGELALINSGTGAVGSMNLTLRSPQGQDLSSGIYWLVVRARTSSGSLEQIRILKFAVAR